MALSKKPVTGMKDILPEEMKIRDYVMGVIKETYGKFGFTSIETPCMENIANLSNKQGGENEKLIFKVLKRGEKLNLEQFIGGCFTASFALKPSEPNYENYLKKLKDVFTHYSKDGYVIIPINTTLRIGKI